MLFGIGSTLSRGQKQKKIVRSLMISIGLLAILEGLLFESFSSFSTLLEKCDRGA